MVVLYEESILGDMHSINIDCYSSVHARICQCDLIYMHEKAKFACEVRIYIDRSIAHAVVLCTVTMGILIYSSAWNYL